jgi:hypothetical protein
MYDNDIDFICCIVVYFWFSASVMMVNNAKHDRSPPSTRFSNRICQWNAILLDANLYHGWFRDNLRCSFSSFNKIARIIEENWCLVNDIPGANTYFSIRDRVAVTLFFLTHCGNISSSGNVFGMGRASAVRYIQKVTNVLQALRKNYVNFHFSLDEFKRIADGFQSIANFPNVIGAIDCTLIEVERPEDFEGWYCRKGFCAFNVQAICDASYKFMSYAIFPGSMTDKSIFNASEFGKICRNIPSEFHIVGDAGYTLKNNLITPYDRYDIMPTDQVRFNYWHSKTRIIIEGAFGILKNRFRILKSGLNMKSMKKNAQIIEGCIILHNILCDIQDDTEIEVPDVLESESDHELSSS